MRHIRASSFKIYDRRLFFRLFYEVAVLRQGWLIVQYLLFFEREDEEKPIAIVKGAIHAEREIGIRVHT